MFTWKSCRAWYVRLHPFWRSAQAKKEDGRLFRKFVARIEALEEELTDKANKNSALAYSVKILREQLEEAECASLPAHWSAGLHVACGGVLDLTRWEPLNSRHRTDYLSLSLTAEGFTGQQTLHHQQRLGFMTSSCMVLKARLPPHRA